MVCFKLLGQTLGGVETLDRIGLGEDEGQTPVDDEK